MLKLQSPSNLNGPCLGGGEEKEGVEPVAEVAPEPPAPNVKWGLFAPVPPAPKVKRGWFAPEDPVVVLPGAAFPPKGTPAVPLLLPKPVPAFGADPVAAFPKRPVALPVAAAAWLPVVVLGVATFLE